MGIRENIKVVKEEISTEEQFLEGMIKTERFFKNKKRYIIGLLTVVILGAIGYSVNTMLEQNRLKSSNEAYELLLKEPQNAAALETLKQKNEKLYEMVRFQMAVEHNDKEALAQLSKSKSPIVADIAAYQLAQMEEGVSAKSELLSGFVFLQEGYALLKEKKIAEAKIKFAQIDPNSPLKQIAQNLEHYQGLK